MASPCPTSRIVTLATPLGRATTTPPATTSESISPMVAARRAVRPGSRLRPWRDSPAFVPARPTGRRAEAAWSGCRRRRHQVRPPRPATERPAAAVSNGGSSVVLANGRAAANCTIATRIRRITQPGAASTAPTASGRPARTAAPPARATSPTAIAGATRGTTARLTIGDRIASLPNDTRTIGRVAAWAAKETPRLSASQRGIRPRPTASIHAVSGVAHTIRPAVASDESWNPASPISFGSLTRRSVAAHPKAAAARPARPLSRAREGRPRAISAARTTEQWRQRHRRRPHTPRSQGSSPATDDGARDGRQPCDGPPQRSQYSNRRWPRHGLLRPS